jgi:hypothetical protein
MHFYIGSKLIKIDNDDPKVVKRILQSLFKNLPTSSQLGGITTVNTLPQQEMLGVQEKGYIVLHAASFETIHIAGTIGLLHCLGISLYDPANKKLVVAHFDIATDAAQIHILLNEFAPTTHLEMRMFGGMCQEEAKDLESQHADSIELFENILYFLYKSVQGDQHINLISNDTFDKVAEFKYHQLQQQQSAKINFAIDCRTGHLVQLSESNTPYTITIENCGIFQEIYQSRGVCTRMHRYLGIDTNKLFKWFDNSSLQAQASCEKKFTDACQLAPIQILIRQLNLQGFAVNDDRCFTDRKLREFLLVHFPTLIGEISKDDIVKLVLDFACVETINHTSPAKLSLCPYSSMEALPLMRLLKSGVIQTWCIQQIRQQIAQLTCVNEGMHHPLIQALSQINGNLHLLQECINFQQCKIESRTYDENNLLAMLTTNKVRNFHELIEHWVKLKIEDGCHRLADNICAKFKAPFNNPDITLFIRQLLQKKFSGLSLEICDLDIFHQNNHRINQRIEELSKAIQARLEQLSIEISRTLTVTEYSETSFLNKFCCYSSPTPPSNAAQAIEERSREVIAEIILKFIEDLLSASLHSKRAAAGPPAHEPVSFKM